MFRLTAAAVRDGELPVRRSKQGGACVGELYPTTHPPTTGPEQEHGERDAARLSGLARRSILSGKGMLDMQVFTSAFVQIVGSFGQDGQTL